MAQALFILDIDANGIVAAHPRRTELPGVVAPVPSEERSNRFNTLRPHLVAIGCMGVLNPGFEFDSSFLNPQTQGKFTRFAQLMQALRDQDEEQRFPPVSVFGHADPVGKPPYNKHLSGRRALSVYGLLTRNTEIWDELFLKPHGGDRWGLRSMRFMLANLRSAETGEPFYVGPIDAQGTAVDKETRRALQAFARERGIKDSGLGGMPSKAERTELYLAYMDFLCHDAAGQPFILSATEHFLARGRDPKTFRGDVQGCSEFNPVLLLSKAEEALFAGAPELEESRNAANAPNRRVIIYIFRHDTEVDPARWPCPVARSGEDQCRKRFWSDHKERLQAGDDRREFKIFQDTMACRFYHGFAHNSPCEAGSRLWVVRFRIDGGARIPVPLRNRRYVVIAGDNDSAPIIRGTLDDKGELRIPVFDERTRMRVKLDVGAVLGAPTAGSNSSAPEDGQAEPSSGFDTDRFPDEDEFLELELDAGALVPATEDLGGRQRLFNLGFGHRPPEIWTKQEQDLAVRSYRRTRNLDPGQDPSTDLESTKPHLEFEHELSDVLEAPPESPAEAPELEPVGAEA